MPVLISHILQSLSKVLLSLLLVHLLNLYSLDLVGHHHGVLFTDLGGGLSLVIIGTVVLVGVPVDATEQVSTATVEPCKAHPFAAQEAPILLGFRGVPLAFFTAGRSYRRRTRSSRLVYNRL